MQKVLTDTFIKRLPAPAEGRIEVADSRCAGLVFRLTANGARSWAFRYKAPETRRDARVTIGSYPDVNLAKARKLADALRKQVGDGIDPAAQRRDARANAETKTFGHLAARYMKEHAERFKRSHKTDARNLRLHILPRWRTRAYASITRADVIALLESVVADGKLTLVNRLQSLISKIFNWSVDADLLPVNPVFRLRRRGVERVGRRVLSDAEIRLFWRSVVAAPISEQTGRALRLTLLTGVRISEVAAISRDELTDIQDGGAASWTVPGERTKNKLPHVVPLAPMARGIILDQLGRLGRDDQFLFPSRARSDAAIQAGTLSQAMMRLGAEISGDDDAVRTWRAEIPMPHDLRRTFATRMAAVGVAKEVRDRLLNHAPGARDTERRHYNAYEFLNEKRAALVAWDAALSAILRHQPAKVVPISRGRRR